jgi:excisionase family DNA binding protein
MAYPTYKEIPLQRNLRDCDPHGFISVADLRRVLRCSRGKIDHMAREGELRKYYVGGNVRFRVQDILQLIEVATGERPDPWNGEEVA